MVGDTKSNIKALFELDDDGYISSYQSEFFNGNKWMTPFDSTNAIDVAQDDLDNIILGATKIVDGKLVIDQGKIAEMKAANDASEKQADQDQATINSLKQQNDLLQSAVMELSNYVFLLPADSSDSTTGSNN